MSESFWTLGIGVLDIEASDFFFIQLANSQSPNHSLNCGVLTCNHCLSVRLVGLPLGAFMNEPSAIAFSLMSESCRSYASACSRNFSFAASKICWLSEGTLSIVLNSGIPSCTDSFIFSVTGIDSCCPVSGNSTTSTLAPNGLPSFPAAFGTI